MMDARGHGLSEGRAMDFGWYGDEDVVAGVELLCLPAGRGRRADRRRRALDGRRGGDRLPRPRTRAFAPSSLRGRATRMPADKAVALRGVRSARRPPGAARQGHLRRGRPTDPGRPAHPPAHGRRARGPDPDAADRCRGGRRRGSRRPVDPGWIPGHRHGVGCPGAGHVGGLRTDPEQWLDRVTTFLDEALGATR